MMENASDHFEFIEAILGMPVRKQTPPRVCNGAVDYGPGKHNKYADDDDAGYAYLYAELCKDHDGIKASVRNRRRADRKHPENKAERQKNKLNRLRKMYGDVWEDGREWYYANGKTGSKKSTEKDAEIFRNLRERSVENDARRDYITDPVEHYVGKTTLQKQIDRKYAELQKIKTDFCEKNFLHPAGDDYAVTAQFGFVVFYPNEFYQKKWELQELELKQKKAYQRKLDKGNKYLRKYVIDEVTA